MMSIGGLHEQAFSINDSAKYFSLLQRSLQTGGSLIRIQQNEEVGRMKLQTSVDLEPALSLECKQSSSQWLDLRRALHSGKL